MLFTQGDRAEGEGDEYAGKIKSLYKCWMSDA